MGHKVNPLIFRSKLYPYYKNIWYDSHSNILKLYFHLKCFIKDNNYLGIINIRINVYKHYYIINCIVKSKENYFKQRILLNKHILNFLKENYMFKINCCFNFVYIIHPFLSTTFLINYIETKLSTSKMSLRKVIPYIVMLINYKYKLKGVKCIVSGRINGVQMAKSEIFRFNRSSGQSKISLVKYSSTNFITKYGIIGIKLWLFLK